MQAERVNYEILERYSRLRRQEDLLNSHYEQQQLMFLLSAHVLEQKSKGQ